MLNFLRTRIRRWLAGPPSSIVEVTIGGEIKRVVARVTVGMKLQCEIPTQHGQEIRLIGSEQAIDKQQFWMLWKRLGGNVMRWPDGSSFDPSKHP